MAKFQTPLEQPLEEESYFVSMTDMMVGLLFIFILMLMYFALQYQNKNEQLANANQTRGEILTKIYESLEAQKFSVEINPETGVLRLNENVLQFASGSADIGSQYHGVITALATALNDVLPCYANEQSYAMGNCTENAQKHWLEAVFIEGHTDNKPFLNRRTGNLGLSTERAANTYTKMIEEKPQIEALKNNDGQPLLSVSGYGDKRPVAEAKDNDTDLHTAMNRRIELRIIMATPKAEEPQAVQELREKMQ